ncbi:hypothetical protein OIV83_006549, partial [Microbotryomycetes sp. JL201]
MFSPYYTQSPYAMAPSCHPFAFAAPRRSACQAVPYMTGAYDSEDDDYDSFDMYRRQLEQQALARKQYERRQREEALLRQQLALEREAERQREYAAYQAALEEERERQRRRAEAVQQAQWRARQQEALRQQRLRQQAFEEQEALRRKQHQRQQQQQQRRQVPVSDAEDVELSDEENPLEPFIELLFGRPLRQKREKVSTACTEKRVPIDAQPTQTEASAATVPTAPVLETAATSAAPETSVLTSTGEESPAVDNEETAAAEHENDDDAS